jgi:hypothetical protein
MAVKNSHKLEPNFGETPLTPQREKTKKLESVPSFSGEMESEEKAVVVATKQLCGCMELMPGFAT